MVKIVPTFPFPSDEILKSDLFLRLPLAESIANLLHNRSESLVICHDAPWGEGKTIFWRGFQNLVIERGAKVLYFDCFSSDYYHEPFVPISDRLVGYLAAESPGERTTIEVQQSASRIRSVLLRAIPRVAVRAASLGFVEMDDFLTAAAEGPAPAQSTRIEAPPGASMDCLYEQFSRDLRIAVEQSTRASNYPLIFIMDELDRCRPEYALLTIERIKHFFGHSNLVFILPINLEALACGLQYIMGTKDLAHQYLERFIDVRVQFRMRDLSSSHESMKRYCAHLFDAHELESDFHNREVIDYCASLSTAFNLPLRTVNRAFSEIAVATATTLHPFPGNMQLLFSLLAFLKGIRSELFTLILAGNTEKLRSELQSLLDSWSKESEEGPKLQAVIGLQMLRTFCLSPEELRTPTQSSDWGRAVIGSLSLTRINMDTLRELAARIAAIGVKGK